METQAQLQMEQREIQEERTKELVEEIQEEQFLKDLYLFMKKRDTPIERIPHLGFKQIDLFVMFKTVKDLGGYHQVTAQQLWKQVYNILGGNPRSTSAATCTRRHYEKLLLPYECHMKGVVLNALPQHQPKHFHYPSYSKEEDDGQRPAKRKMLSLPLHQNLCNLQSDPHGSVFPLTLQPHYYHPSHTILPPFVPISSSVLTSHNPPAPQPRFAFPPSHPNLTERIKKPLEHLRFLAEQYKTSSGLAEPLNLSVKASSRETNSNPTSSFAPPSSSKNPKFLNKPSPLYTPLHPQVVRNEACETQDDEADLEVTPYPVKAMEGYAVELKSKTASSSPSVDSAPTLRTDESGSAMAPKSSSPKPGFTIQPTAEREGSPEVRIHHNPSHILPSPPRENGGKMEIEIPLSVFHNWLKLCRPPAMMHQAKQLPPPFQDEHSGQRHCSNTDNLPTNLTFHMNAQYHEQSSAIEDLRLGPRNVPRPIVNIQTTGNHHNTSQNHFTSYKPLPLSNILKNAARQEVYPFDQQDINKSYGSKPQTCCNAYDKESQAPTIPVKTGSSPPTVLQDLTVTKSFNEDTNQGGKEKSEMGSSAVLMVNSSSLLHLTTEEVLKLKKIISSSS